MKQHDVIISGHHLDLTDSIKHMVHEKVEKLFAHEEHIVRLRVELEYDKHQGTHQNEFSARGHIEMRGKDIVIKESGNDLYKCIDDLVVKLDRGLRRRSRLARVKRKQSKPLDIPASIPKSSPA
ncbi:MAG: ribosome hibernation-promoting factor, HPF/YfiA family [Opitutales bacterium]